MTQSLADVVLKALRESSPDRGPISLADLARRFGVSPALITSCAKQLVAEGLVEPTMAIHRGVPAIQSLAPLRTAEPA
jgi:Mn-dependent DtxR family transcriptional regulator